MKTPKARVRAVNTRTPDVRKRNPSLSLPSEDTDNVPESSPRKKIVNGGLVASSSKDSPMELTDLLMCPTGTKTPSAHSRAANLGTPKSKKRKVSSIFKSEEKNAPGNLETPTAEASTKKMIDSKMKTRQCIKSDDRFSRCTLCKKVKGDLVACTTCESKYHPRKCLNYSEDIAEIIQTKKNWQCPKCITCYKCKEFIDDLSNRECSLCLRAWHGICTPGKIQHSMDTWTCPTCKKKGSTSPIKLTAIDMSEDLERFSPELGAFDIAPILPSKKGRGRPRRSSLVDCNILPTLVTKTADEVFAARKEVNDRLLEHHRQQDSPKKGSPKKRDRNRAPPKVLLPSDLVRQEDYDLFMAAKAEWMNELPSTSSNTEGVAGKWINIGAKENMKALYDSPYPEEIQLASTIFICPFCLHGTGDENVYRIHRENCDFHHPPGNEVYRDENISFFEVDGNEQKTYCRNLCLLAKLFISSKTLHHEVDTFIFYVLTELASDGCRIVGYFSKEKNPSKNNNLSCILTLPSEGRKGYGYELSRMERKIGSPEHPLSDLGLLAYRGFWRASIICYLRSIRGSTHISIKNIALVTRIHPSDIIAQMLRDKLLVYKDGTYYIKQGKRSWKWPLSTFRRKSILRDKIYWKPSFDESMLDSSKLNYYI